MTAAARPPQPYYVACGACRFGVTLVVRSVIVRDCAECHYIEKHTIWKWEMAGGATA